MGTADPVVPYAGSQTFTGAVNASLDWQGIDGCDTSKAVSTPLPILVQDGTSVIWQQNAACRSGDEVDLYTVNGGGHAWPGSTNPVHNVGLGIISQNLDATTVIGQFAFTNENLRNYNGISELSRR
jgi:polyhydroxybutyrate depolymerase